MGICKQCGEVYSALEMKDGLCKNCNPELKQEEQKKQKKEKIEQAKLDSIILTTEPNIEKIVERIEIISCSCVYGLNIIKDLFVGIRNIVGGRIKSIEEPLLEAKKEILNDFRKQAYNLNGDAVVNIKIEHTYNNAGAANMVSIFATGTVVKLKK